MAKSRRSKSHSRKFSMKVRPAKSRHTAKSLAHATLVYALKHKLSRKQGMNLVKSLRKNAKKLTALPRSGNSSLQAHKNLITRGGMIAYRDHIKRGAFMKALKAERKSLKKSHKKSRSHKRRRSGKKSRSHKKSRK